MSGGLCIGTPVAECVCKTKKIRSNTHAKDDEMIRIHRKVKGRDKING
jgi:hypothetical protein